MKKFFDASAMTYFPLKERLSKVDIVSSCVSPDSPDIDIPSALKEKAESIANEIRAARSKNASVICAFGAHAIKNGLGRLLGEMLSRGWFTHLAANGAAVIHDWEFSFLGRSNEDVRENVSRGRFGAWEETGFYINLALALGAYLGLGYGSSVGSMIAGNGLLIPEKEELLEAIKAGFSSGEVNEKNDSSGEEREKKAGNSPGEESLKKAGKAAAALDLLELLESERQFHNRILPSGFLSISHPWADYSVLATAEKAGKPFTCHPMIGHDIIYTHRAMRGAVIGRTAERDFLEFTSSVAGLEGGVYLSVGSAVMSPMIFEKALSMARNAAGGKGIEDCDIHVVDLGESGWDWSRGEPPMDNPAYYLRFMKTFNRMGMRADYTQGDNREFFTALYRALDKK